MFNKSTSSNYKGSNGLIFASIYASGIEYYNRINIKVGFIYYSRQIPLLAIFFVHKEGLVVPSCFAGVKYTSVCIQKILMALKITTIKHHWHFLGCGWKNIKEHLCTLLWTNGHRIHISQMERCLSGDALGFLSGKSTFFLVCLLGIPSPSHRVHWELCCSKGIMQKENIFVSWRLWG